MDTVTALKLKGRKYKPVFPRATGKPTDYIEGYPYEDGQPMSTTIPHSMQLLTFFGQLVRYFASDEYVLVGADNFIYYREGDPTKCVAPDVYVILGVEKAVSRRSFYTWAEGAVPAAVFEFISDSTADYDRNEKVRLYLMDMGVSECFIHQPHLSEPPEFHGWRRSPSGSIVEIEPDEQGTLFSEPLNFRFQWEIDLPQNVRLLRPYLPDETHASSDIIGVKGNITYRETELCNEGPPLNAENPWDNSAAWIGTHYFWQSGSKIVWAQTGWRRFNNETEINNSYVRERVYFEIGEYHVSPRVVNFKRTDKPNTIIPNKDEYKVELTDEDEGEWKAYLGGTYWHTFKDTYWENRQGNRLQASGEIHTETTDMPGVNSDRVEFSEVQWEHTLSGWQDSEFDGDDGEEILSGNPEDLRWGDNIVSATKVEIWDKDPN